MSRIGNNPISIPESVSVTYNDMIVTVKGKMGELSQYIDKSISVNIEDSIISLTRSLDSKDIRSMHGLYRSLINNMIKGVNEGHTKKLELRGVGYRASTQGDMLDISIGYSHNIVFNIASELKVEADTEKGKAPIITITGCDKQLVGLLAAKIRSERKPEPYKGKGIRYVDEYVRKKAGKTAATT
mgnify:CR=1 FL=1|tara:strand:+ start:702 stop:1256 length:555 start_codon:yes stop_codon:yes gene_type:complete